MLNAESPIYNNLKADLQLLWSIENALLTALPNMIRKAYDYDLVNALCSHFNETGQHKTTLETIFNLIGITPHGLRVEILESILAENLGAIISSSLSDVDVLIIEGAQEIEHYQIHEYQNAANKADRLGLSRVHEHLLTLISEQKHTCKRMESLLGSLQSHIA